MQARNHRYVAGEWSIRDHRFRRSREIGYRIHHQLEYGDGSEDSASDIWSCVQRERGYVTTITFNGLVLFMCKSLYLAPNLN